MHSNENEINKNEIKTKICSKCKIEKELINFAKDKTNKTGYDGKCKQCRKVHYSENKAVIMAKGKIYYQNNREYFQKYLKQWNKDNKEKLHEYRSVNKDKKSEYLHYISLNLDIKKIEIKLPVANTEWSLFVFKWIEELCKKYPNVEIKHTDRYFISLNIESLI